MQGDFMRSTYPTARKDYKCGLCDRPIVKGQRHDKVAGRSEYWTGFKSIRICGECHKPPTD